jgi:hypothetical protein
MLLDILLSTERNIVPLCYEHSCIGLAPLPEAS